MSLKSRNFVDYFAICGLDTQIGLESSEQQTNSESNETEQILGNYNHYSSWSARPPLERSYKCKVLKHFPEKLPWCTFDEYAVTQLCMPNGLTFQKHPTKPKYHPFVITREDGSRVYGAALTFFELIELDSICNAMQTLQTMYDAEYSALNNQSSNSMPKSLTPSSIRTINSNNNLGHQRSLSAQHHNSLDLSNSNAGIMTSSIKSSHLSSTTHVFSHHNYNIMKDSLYASKTICLLSTCPFNRAFSSILNTLYQMVEQIDLLGKYKKKYII
jgi:hypothetical protein